MLRRVYLVPQSSRQPEEAGPRWPGWPRQENSLTNEAGNRLRCPGVGKVLQIPRSVDPFDELNAEQRAAVTHGEGPLLVVAGAGTGKTRVITQRIRYLLESNPGLTGENILGLTYTRKAAAEMKQRVVEAIGARAENLTLGTFHSFCFQILLEQNPGLGLIDNFDHWILLRRNIRQLQLEEFKRLAEPGKFLEDFVDFFSRCQDELVTPDEYQQFVDRLRERFEREQDALEVAQRAARETELRQQAEVASAYRASDRLLRERNLLTFGAALLEAVMQLRANRALLELLRARYRHVLVDEFQDTNIAQLELLWLLAGEHRNIVAVGDDDQAIYRFRGASFGSFQVFAQKFLGRKIDPQHLPGEVVLLTRNYRSSQRILRVAGQAIAMNADRMFPAKRLVAENAPGEKINIVELGTPAEEACWVAGDLERGHAEGHRWREFAVLYRMHTHRDLLVAELVRRGIPFVIRNRSVLNNRLVRDVLAYLRLVATPADNVACARVLAAPAWGLEPADLARLCERAGTSTSRSLWEVLEAAQGELAFARGARRTGELVAWVSELRRRAREASVTELLQEILAGMNLVLPGSDPDRPHLDRFVAYISEWERKSQTRELREFIEYFRLYREAGGDINLEEEPERDAVQLMTAHSAKGLEFGRVFLLRLVRKAFPAGERPRVLEFPLDLMKEEKPQGEFHIQEERRLFYVALTRARQRLTLTTVVNKRMKQSEFLEDILEAPHIARADVQTLELRVELPGEDTGGAPPEQLFGPADPNARAYSRIGEWAQTYRPPVTEPLRLSASAIDTYQSCPLKYLLGHAWGVRGGPHAVMTFGSVMHNTIRELVREVSRKRHLDFEDVEAIYEREWRSAGFADDYQEEEYKKDGLEQLRVFHSSYARQPADVLHQEKQFELPVEGNIVVTGRMDQVNRLDEKEVEIVDYKTGRPKKEQDAEKSLQLSLYALAAREVFDLQPALLTFYNLTTNEPVSAGRDAKQLNRALDTVQEVADDIRAGHFPAAPGFACRACDFTPICPAHEQLVKIRTGRE